MRIDPAILARGGRSAALVWRLGRDFMRPHLPRVLLAFLLMGLAAASTAGRAWLMEPVLDRIFVAREGSLLLLIAGGALALALIKGLADYGEAVLMTRIGQRVIADVQIALFARLMRADLGLGIGGHPANAPPDRNDRSDRQREDEERNESEKPILVEHHADQEKDG